MPLKAEPLLVLGRRVVGRRLSSLNGRKSAGFFPIQIPPESIQCSEVGLERIPELKQELVDFDVSVTERLAMVELRPDTQPLHVCF